MKATSPIQLIKKEAIFSVLSLSGAHFDFMRTFAPDWASKYNSGRGKSGAVEFVQV